MWPNGYICDVYKYIRPLTTPPRTKICGHSEGKWVRRSMLLFCRAAWKRSYIFLVQSLCCRHSSVNYLVCVKKSFIFTRRIEKRSHTAATTMTTKYTWKESEYEKKVKSKEIQKETTKQKSFVKWDVAARARPCDCKFMIMLNSSDSLLKFAEYTVFVWISKRIKVKINQLNMNIVNCSQKKITTASENTENIYNFTARVKKSKLI